MNKCGFNEQDFDDADYIHEVRPRHKVRPFPLDQWTPKQIKEMTTTAKRLDFNLITSPKE